MHVRRPLLLLPQVCATCLVERPPRSKHDPSLGACVRRFDHFCPFLNNAVGEDNYPYFFGFLTFIVLAIGLHLIVAVPAMTNYCGASDATSDASSTANGGVAMMTIGGGGLLDDDTAVAGGGGGGGAGAERLLDGAMRNGGRIANYGARRPPVVGVVHGIAQVCVCVGVCREMCVEGSV